MLAETLEPTRAESIIFPEEPASGLGFRQRSEGHTNPDIEQGNPMAKAQDAKKETKKKPEKTLKEKRVEKQAKKSTKG